MFHIIPAILEHGATIAQLNRRVHQLHLDHAPHFFRQPSDAERIQAFGALLAQPNMRDFLAVADDTAVGYVLAQIHERPATAFNAARRWMYVDQISVEPQWEGQGIGRGLLEAVRDCARAKGIRELDVSTWAFNTRAQALFAAFGFQPTVLRYWMLVDELG